MNNHTWHENGNSQWKSCLTNFNNVVKKEEMTMDNLTQIKGLKLYQYQSCPYCAATREAINKTGLYIEERDVLINPEYRKELVEGGGKPQVPALRIETNNGEVKWLYESKDIIDFLHFYVLQLSQAA